MWIFVGKYNFVDREKFEDTKGVFKSRKSKKDRQHNGKRKKGQTTINKIPHSKLKIEQHEPH
jgi:hypothetical protein